MLLRFIFTLLLAALTTAPTFAADCTETFGQGAKVFSLATGSPGELGLLKALAEDFAKDNDAKMCWVKAGSGASLKLLQAGKVDMIMVHAPAAEKKAVEEGWAVKRTLIGSNEFYIVGPTDDPAGIAAAKDAADAYQRIAAKKSLFFSRGDNSGTHKKEMDAWKNAGVTPSGDWYVVTKDFMMATLGRANAEGGYFMTDSSTWVAARQEMANLKILFRGDRFLVNTYNALTRPADGTSGTDLSVRFIDYVASEAGQKIIVEYGKDKYGEGLYNDAAYARQYDR
ncbi:MAG: ABC transporter substrate-binding protein [Deltaproteobacteria bacterium HGW-Deltaproteobacteria-18]|nr:MAG: ABC transporter substrate-binding protein [Deltaproteobacteria bacterium HGW-Deltaproteobacteria-18]